MMNNLNSVFTQAGSRFCWFLALFAALPIVYADTCVICNKEIVPDKQQPIKKLYQDLKVYIVTFNLAGRSPGDIKNYSGLFDSGLSQDIYIIAFEEIFEIKPKEVLFNPRKFFNPSGLIKKHTEILDGIFKKKAIYLVKTENYKFLSLWIYAKKDKLKEFSNVESRSIPFMTSKPIKVLGNLRFKGSVAIRLVYNQVSIAFVAAHMVAHKENNRVRIDNYNEITTQFEFLSAPKSILEHDFLFISGDLNFRVDAKFENIMKDIKKKQYVKLVEKDQLTMAIRKGDAFVDFQEGTINFPPTFKFVKGTDIYDSKRRPSYTDRILYYSFDNVDTKEDTAVKIHSYESLPHFMFSDHKPVRAIFSLPAAVFKAKAKVDSSSRPKFWE